MDLFNQLACLIYTCLKERGQLKADVLYLTFIIHSPYFICLL